MRDIPIIFSAPMIRALLEDRKTMTRRLAWRTQKEMPPDRSRLRFRRPYPRAKFWEVATPWQRVEPRDRLWVREQLRGDGQPGNKRIGIARYGADGEMVLPVQHIEGLGNVKSDCLWDWERPLLPSIHMPRWASRLTLIVTATKIERLQEISEAEVLAEGLRKLSKDAVGQEARGLSPTWKYGLPESDGLPGPAGWQWHEWRISPVDAFEKLWASVHGPDSWNANPEVVALTFTVHKMNIDAMPETEAA